MFAYLKGLLMAATPSQTVIEVQGVGYLVFIPCSALGRLPQIGDSVKLYTSLVIREFSHALYGFMTQHERDIFEILMNVSGVGPKLALSLIGHLPPDQLRSAIQNQELISLCRVPGVGKKTAERLVIELRDKLPHSTSIDSLELTIPRSISDVQTQQLSDAVLALINLGYSQSVAQKAIKQTLKDMSGEVDLATLITTALKNV